MNIIIHLHFMSLRIHSLDLVQNLNNFILIQLLAIFLSKNNRKWLSSFNLPTNCWTDVFWPLYKPLDSIMYYSWTRMSRLGKYSKSWFWITDCMISLSGISESSASNLLFKWCSKYKKSLTLQQSPKYPDIVSRLLQGHQVFNLRELNQAIKYLIDYCGYPFLKVEKCQEYLEAGCLDSWRNLSWPCQPHQLCPTSSCWKQNDLDFWTQKDSKQPKI
jgi:hypothetical protein